MSEQDVIAAEDSFEISILAELRRAVPVILTSSSYGERSRLLATLRGLGATSEDLAWLDIQVGLNGIRMLAQNARTELDAAANEARNRIDRMSEGREVFRARLNEAVSAVSVFATAFSEVARTEGELGLLRSLAEDMALIQDGIAAPKVLRQMRNRLMEFTFKPGAAE